MEKQKDNHRYDGRGEESPQWWPSRYGEGDELGAGNELTPARTLAALKIPKTGEVISLGHIMEENPPAAYPPARFNLLVLAHGELPHMYFGDESQNSYMEDVMTQSVHIGTHMDGLGHSGIAGRHYNGLHHSEIYSPTGLLALGIHKAKPWITRGVLLDIARIVGEPVLPEGFAVNATHLEEACTEHGLEIGAGDAVLIHTGWSTLWDTDPHRYASTTVSSEFNEPGLGWDGAHWLTDRRVSLVGADNWALEVIPFENDKRAYVVHQHLLAETGTYILENITTGELAKRESHEFLFVMTPNRIKGATGSIVAPTAIL